MHQRAHGGYNFYRIVFSFGAAPQVQTASAWAMSRSTNEDLETPPSSKAVSPGTADGPPTCFTEGGTAAEVSSAHATLTEPQNNISLSNLRLRPLHRIPGQNKKEREYNIAPHEFSSHMLVFASPASHLFSPARHVRSDNRDQKHPGGGGRQ